MDGLFLKPSATLNQITRVADRLDGLPNCPRVGIEAVDGNEIVSGKTWLTTCAQNKKSEQDGFVHVNSDRDMRQRIATQGRY